MDELLTMSNQEMTRLEVMQRIKEKRMTQKEAAQMLGISTRQVKRLYRGLPEGRSQGIRSVSGGANRATTGWMQALSSRL